MRALIALAALGGAAALSAAVAAPPSTSSRALLDAMVSARAPDAAAVETLVRGVESEASGEALDTAKLRGDWRLCYQYNAQEATKSQKAFARTGLPQFSNFVTDAAGREVFRNIVALSKARARVVADVAWREPVAATPRRLGSTIVAAHAELSLGRRFGWRPLRAPLPLKGEGWLDVTYLSDEMRVTRGNRGGLFVHVRPELVATSPGGDEAEAVAREAPTRSALKTTLTRLGSLLALPALAKALLLVVPPPAAIAPIVDDYLGVWSKLLPAGLRSARFLGVVGALEFVAVLAMNGALKLRGRSLERVGGVLCAGAAAGGVYTHAMLGQPFYHAAVVGLMYLANAFVVRE